MIRLLRRTPALALLVLTALLAALLSAGTVPEAAADQTGARPQPVVYEAEDGRLNGTVVESSAPGYSGTGYVAGFDAAEDSVTVTVPDGPAGLHDLTIHYRAPYGQKVASLQLNGEGAGDVTLAATDTFSTVAAGKVLLQEGADTITIVNNWGWYEIDAISLSPSEPRPPHQVSGVPVDPQATPEARALMSYLTAGYGEHILSGQQDAASIRWLEENVGRAPAVAYHDMMDYFPSRVERGTTSTEVENALAWDERGGITTFVWHWNAPMRPHRRTRQGVVARFLHRRDDLRRGRGARRPAVRGVRTAAARHRRHRGRAEAAAGRGRPGAVAPAARGRGRLVLVGAKGPGLTKELWRLMYERMTGHHGLHNLIWVWNSVDPAWYPGDDVVDVISADTYPRSATTDRPAVRTTSWSTSSATRSSSP